MLSRPKTTNHATGDNQPTQPSPKTFKPQTQLKRTSPSPVSPWHDEGTTQSYRCYKCRSYFFMKSSIHQHMRVAHKITLDDAQSRRCLWRKGRPEPKRSLVSKKMVIPRRKRAKTTGDDVTVVQIPHPSKRHLDGGDNSQV